MPVICIFCKTIDVCLLAPARSQELSGNFWKLRNAMEGQTTPCMQQRPLLSAIQHLNRKGWHNIQVWGNAKPKETLAVSLPFSGPSLRTILTCTEWLLAAWKANWILLAGINQYLRTEVMNLGSYHIIDCTNGAEHLLCSAWNNSGVSPSHFWMALDFRPLFSQETAFAQPVLFFLFPEHHFHSIMVSVSKPMENIVPQKSP